MNLDTKNQLRIDLMIMNYDKIINEIVDFSGRHKETEVNKINVC